MMRLALASWLVILGSVAGSAQQNQLGQQPFPALSPEAKAQLQQGAVHEASADAPRRDHEHREARDEQYEREARQGRRAGRERERQRQRRGEGEQQAREVARITEREPSPEGAAQRASERDCHEAPEVDEVLLIVLVA